MVSHSFYQKYFYYNEKAILIYNCFINKLLITLALVTLHLDFRHVKIFLKTIERENEFFKVLKALKIFKNLNSVGCTTVSSF